MDNDKGCVNCYYESFDGKAYPCSMCIRGLTREDKWHPKMRSKSKKTQDYCKSCKHTNCNNCVADNSDPYCVPSNYEQTERRE